MSLPRPRLDYALTVGPLLLALLAFTMFHHCVPTVSGKYIKFCVFVYPATGLPESPLLGNGNGERRRAPARWTRRVASRIARNGRFCLYAPQRRCRCHRPAWSSSSRDRLSCSVSLDVRHYRTLVSVCFTICLENIDYHRRRSRAIGFNFTNSPIVLHDSRSSFLETNTVRLVDAIFFIFVYRQVGSVKEYAPSISSRLTDREVDSQVQLTAKASQQFRSDATRRATLQTDETHVMVYLTIQRCSFIPHRARPRPRALVRVGSP
ncbi:hypothetical protein ALC57_10369 [Trachymyrmex cornetzi]|uniref:Uncharacterized protein n=1 Tax=Trachymyrmex cornetzi TaxID=471704 RepID=A0A195DWY5_9HYME|nr:hypothetical protein ALC57_10369 [Trachymyrmex cornetzi]